MSMPRPRRFSPSARMPSTQTTSRIRPIEPTGTPDSMRREPARFASVARLIVAVDPRCGAGPWRIDLEQAPAIDTCPFDSAFNDDGFDEEDGERGYSD